MTYAFNLILVHSKGWQDVADFEAIQQRVEARAQDIRTFICSNESRSHSVRKAAATLPTLVFSPIRLLWFRPDRGKIYQGAAMSKLEEMRILREAALPVPHYTELMPDSKLSKSDFGSLTLLKPSFAHSSFGRGLELNRTENVVFRAPSDFPPEHPGSRAPMIAQRFIDCGYAMSCRVLTFFGAPVFTYLRRSTVPLDLASSNGPFEDREFLPMRPNMEIAVPRDPDILHLAKRAYQAMPERALQACDILRDKDGKLYILEVNPGGGTWMFSSPEADGYKFRLGVSDLAAEFDAFDVIAEKLIERTRLEAE